MVDGRLTPRQQRGDQTVEDVGFRGQAVSKPKWRISSARTTVPPDDHVGPVGLDPGPAPAVGGRLGGQDGQELLDGVPAEHDSGGPGAS